MRLSCGVLGPAASDGRNHHPRRIERYVRVNTPRDYDTIGSRLEWFLFLSLIIGYVSFKAKRRDPIRLMGSVDGVFQYQTTGARIYGG